MNLRLLTLAAASALGLDAHALVTDWGVHDRLEVGAALKSPGSFADTYRFSLPGSFQLASDGVTNNLTDALRITYGDVTLFRETGAIDDRVGSFVYNGQTGNVSRDFGVLAGGDYYYEVTGTAQGTLGGYYTIASTITAAVPEPQAYALMLGGLIALGVVARRRRG